MRIAFVNNLYKNAKKNKEIFLITADLGFSVFEEYITNLPNQFLNIGISEQNMTGVAAGMAMEGKIPFIYSIVPFSTMRNFEQIRNDICYQNLNVKIVGVGAGFSYGPYGHTHHGLEDIGILRTLPNMTIFCPGDPVETAFCVDAALKIKGPVYIRLGRAGEPTVHTKKPSLKSGKGYVLRNGKDYTIIATSTMLYRATEVADILQKKKITGRIVSMHTIKPFDDQIIKESIDQTRALFTLEEHSLIGGLGSATSEVVAEYGRKTIFRRIGVPDRFTKTIGDQEHMRKANGLEVRQIAKTIIESIRGSKS